MRKRNWIKVWSGMVLVIVLILTLVSSLELNYVSASPDWLAGEWDYRLKLTVNSSLIDSNLTHFPVLVVLNNSNMDFSPTQIDGDDIRFTQDNGETLLDYEFEVWDKAGEEAWIWVSDSTWTINSTADTDFYMYYGNDEASTGENITGVWNSNYKMVHHMANDNGNVDDSTSNNNDGTKQSTGHPAEVVGIVGMGQDFDGSQDDITFTNCQNAAEGTIEVLLKLDSKTELRSILIDDGAGYLVLSVKPANYFGFQAFDTIADWIQTSAEIDTGIEYHVAGVYKTGEKRLLYLDGSLNATSAVNFTGLGGTAKALVSGTWGDIAARFYDGIICEIRVSNIARSTAWIKGTYYSNLDNLLTYGAIEKVPCTPILNTLAATSIEETTATLQGEVTDYCLNTVTERGFVWGTTTQGLPGNTTAPASAGYDNNWTETNGNFAEETFSHSITSLTEGELYYYRACANSTSGAGYWGYGNEETFLTKPIEPNTLVAVDGVGESIDLTWNKGVGAQNTEIWGQSGSYPAGRGTGILTYNSTGTNYNDTNPSVGETWYYRAWSYVAEGVLFHYSDIYDEDYALCVVTPSITTNTASDVEETTATLNATITNTGGENNNERGFDWDIDSGAPYTNDWTEVGSYGTGVFTHGIDTLTPGEFYYFRGKTHNSEDWAYGTELTFLTKPNPPTNLVCSENTTINSTYLTWNNGTGRDTTVIRYSTGDYPADYDSGTLAYNSTGTSTDILSLNLSTEYYFRAWSWCTEEGLQRWSDTYEQCSEYTLPGNPSNLSNITTDCSVALDWTKGESGDKTHIRGLQDAYPADVSSGTQIYFGTSNSTTHNIGDDQIWYYRAWSYNSTSTKYSASYSQTISDIGLCLGRPDAPTNFIITQTGTGSVNISWTIGIGADTTVVRVSEDGCPVDYTDGYAVYSGADDWYEYIGVNLGLTTYCFRAWSHNEVGYSINYVEGKIGGDDMVVVAFVILPLGLFGFALWQRKTWIMIGAAISFVALAAYGLIEGSSGEALWIMGIFSIMFAFIIFLYAFFGMREKAEVIPFEAPDDAYARELKEESSARRAKRRERMGLD